MIKECSTVKIVFPPQLMEIKLSGVVNKTGVVIEDLSDKDRKSKGYMVQLHSSFLEEYLWFIPIQSVIEYEPTI